MAGFFRKLKQRKQDIQHLLNKNRREVLPGNDPMIHQFPEGGQGVGHDHVTPERHRHLNTHNSKEEEE